MPRLLPVSKHSTAKASRANSEAAALKRELQSSPQLVCSERGTSSCAPGAGSSRSSLPTPPAPRGFPLAYPPPRSASRRSAAALGASCCALMLRQAFSKRDDVVLDSLRVRTSGLLDLRHPHLR
jgi:hypothetical protein